MQSLTSSAIEETMPIAENVHAAGSRPMKKPKSFQPESVLSKPARLDEVILSTNVHADSREDTYVSPAEFRPSFAITDRLMHVTKIVTAIPIAIAASSAGSHLFIPIEIARDSAK